MSSPASPDTFAKLLLQHAAQRGDRPALREKRRGIWRTQSWRELADEVRGLAAALTALGLTRGAHVAFLGENRPRLMAGMAAAQWLGAVVVPLFPDAGAAEITGPLRDSGVTHAFAENQEQVDKLLAAMPACPALRCIVYDRDRGLRHYRQPQLASYATLLAQGRAQMAGQAARLDAELARGSAADAACVLYTAGTTGPARGVVLSHGALIDRARVAAAADGIGATDASLAYLPPAWIGQHIYAYALPLVSGASVCCPEASDTMLADLREMGPTLFLATPRVLEALVTQVFVRMEGTGPLKRALYRSSLAVARRVGGIDRRSASLPDRLAYAASQLLIYGPLRDVLGLTRLRAAYCTGEALDAELLVFYRSIGVNLKQFYGSTEAGGLVALQHDGQVRPGRVGPASPGVEIKVAADGEVLVRSPGLFSGYQGDAEASARALADGWLRTGDAGTLDADGNLQIIDRLADLGRLADGSPYAPKPIENRLKFSPYINEAVAFGAGRDGVCVLVDIEGSTVSHWADKREISYTGHADLASRPEVYRLVADCIAEVNAELARAPGGARSQVRRFVVLPQELDPDDGVMTRMRKLRREAIATRYAALVDAMYGGAERCVLDDARGRTELRIGTVPTLTSPTTHV